MFSIKNISPLTNNVSGVLKPVKALTFIFLLKIKYHFCCCPKLPSLLFKAYFLNIYGVIDEYNESSLVQGAVRGVMRAGSKKVWNTKRLSVFLFSF